MKFTVRPAEEKDSEALGRMGAALARLHHDFDPPRFMLSEDLEQGYSWWLGKEAKSKKAVVLVAEAEDGRIIGYAYGRIESRDWNMLLDAHGGLHDLWVEPEARTYGVGEKLTRAAVEALTKLGAPRVVLHTAARNEVAQRFFKRLGLRPTMVELPVEAEKS